MIEHLLFPQMQANDLPSSFRRLLGLLWLSCGHSPPSLFDPSKVAPSTAEDEALSLLAISHGVIPWLLRHLAEPERYLSPALLASWRQQDRNNKIRVMNNCMWVVRLTRALQNAGISCLPIKGVCTAQRYHGDVSARSCGDVDLMVTPEQLESAQQIFLQLGLKQTFPARALNTAEALWVRRNMHHLTFREPASNLLIELHWALHDNNLLEHEDRQWPKLASAQLSIAGTEVLALDPPRDYLLLLTHAGRSAWGCIKWLLDLHLAWNALNEADRLVVENRIAELSLEPAQQIFRSLARALFGADNGGALIANLPSELSLLLASTQPKHWSTPLADVRNLYRLRNSRRYQWSTLKLRALSWHDMELLRLPTFAFPLYFPLRLPMLIYRNLVKPDRDH